MSSCVSLTTALLELAGVSLQYTNAASCVLLLNERAAICIRCMAIILGSIRRILLVFFWNKIQSYQHATTSLKAKGMTPKQMQNVNRARGCYALILCAVLMRNP
eukprot:scaffold13566_cov88-Skeletonema_dohrnii-CCMP3373.AAC.1